MRPAVGSFVFVHFVVKIKILSLSVSGVVTEVRSSRARSILENGLIFYLFRILKFGMVISMSLRIMICSSSSLFVEGRPKRTSGPRLELKN